MATCMPLMRITPSEFQFEENGKPGRYISRLKLINLREKPVAFKLKTNQPRMFTVKPVMGALMNKGDSISIIVKSSEHVAESARFLIQTVLLGQEEAQTLSLSYWGSVDKERIMEDIIGCKLLPHSETRDIRGSNVATRRRSSGSSVSSYSSITSTTSSTSTLSGSHKPSTYNISGLSTLTADSSRQSDKANGTSTASTNHDRNHVDSMSPLQMVARVYKFLPTINNTKGVSQRDILYFFMAFFALSFIYPLMRSWIF